MRIVEEKEIAKLESIEESLLAQGDFFDLLEKLPDACVDFVLTDLPYNTTILHWDKQPIDLERMWKALDRVIKPNAAMAMFSLQPFTSRLIFSNVKHFRYCWVWEKTSAGNFLHARKQPLKRHEDICVFYKKQPTYNPQMAKGKAYTRNGKIKSGKLCPLKGKIKTDVGERVYGDERYPHTVLRFAGDGKRVHATQKPVRLLEYLIKTYSNEGDVVLDLTMGSGSTCVAAIHQKRKFIGVELDKEIFETAKGRVLEAVSTLEKGERKEGKKRSRDENVALDGAVVNEGDCAKESVQKVPISKQGFRGLKKIRLARDQMSFDW